MAKYAYLANSRAVLARDVVSWRVLTIRPAASDNLCRWRNILKPSASNSISFSIIYFILLWSNYLYYYFSLIYLLMVTVCLIFPTSINGSTVKDFLNKKDSLRDFQTDHTTKCQRVVEPSVLQHVKIFSIFKIYVLMRLLKWVFIPMMEIKGNTR